MKVSADRLASDLTAANAILVLLKSMKTGKGFLRSLSARLANNTRTREIGLNLCKEGHLSKYRLAKELMAERFAGASGEVAFINGFDTALNLAAQLCEELQSPHIAAALKAMGSAQAVPLDDLMFGPVDKDQFND
jgi:hypothetical protein